MAWGHGAGGEGDHAAVTLWSILEDLGKPKDAAALDTLGERSLPELGCPCPTPVVLGAEGTSSGTFLPSVPQQMQRAWAGPGFWVEGVKCKLSDG